MGNTSTLEYDSECFNHATIDDTEFLIDFYIEKRWFVCKLTKAYELLIYEIVKNVLLDVKYFDLEYPIQENMLELYTELHTSSSTIKEKINIRQCVLRRTEMSDIQKQIDILEDDIDKKNHPDKEDIPKYLDILRFFQKNIAPTEKKNETKP